MAKSRPSSQNRRLVSKPTPVQQTIEPEQSQDDELDTTVGPQDDAENIDPQDDGSDNGSDSDDDNDNEDEDDGTSDGDGDGDGPDGESGDDGPDGQDDGANGAGSTDGGQNPPQAPEAQPTPDVAAVDPADRLAALREEGRKQVQPPKGRIIRYGEPITVEGRDDGSSIVVSEDIYQEVFVRRSNRPTYVLKFRKGTRVARTSMRQVTQK